MSRDWVELLELTLNSTRGRGIYRGYMDTHHTTHPLYTLLYTSYIISYAYHSVIQTNFSKIAQQCVYGLYILPYPHRFRLVVAKLGWVFCFQIELVFLCAILYTTVSHNNTTHKFQLYTRIIYKLSELLIYKSIHPGWCEERIRGLVSTEFPPKRFPLMIYNAIWYDT